MKTKFFFLAILVFAFIAGCQTESAKPPTDTVKTDTTKVALVIKKKPNKDSIIAADWAKKTMNGYVNSSERLIIKSRSFTDVFDEEQRKQFKDTAPNIRQVCKFYKSLGKNEFVKRADKFIEDIYRAQIYNGRIYQHENTPGIYGVLLFEARNYGGAYGILVEVKENLTPYDLCKKTIHVMPNGSSFVSFVVDGTATNVPIDNKKALEMLWGMIQTM